MPTLIGTELKYLEDSIKKGKFSGDGYFTNKCTEILRNKLNASSVLLTTSCTHALEMCAILLDIKSGDEVIMPSYTFVSTANAFILRGAKVVFIDIEPDMMNINPAGIENAITSKTRAIVVVHYAGVGCDMDSIMRIAKKYNIPVIEDAAQAIGSSYHGKSLGTIGTFGCISFHETKNLHCGEGGALIINDKKYIERAEIIREKGTNRKKYIMGLVDKYSWVDIGSSYLLSELNAAFLYPQLNSLVEITNNRKYLWQEYYSKLTEVLEITVQPYPKNIAEFNAHIFFIKVKNIEIRGKLIEFLFQKGISATFHYISLHTASASKIYSEFRGTDLYTTMESERLLRLPLYYGLKKEDVNEICNEIKEFFKKNYSI